MQLAEYERRKLYKREARAVHRSALEPHVTWVEMHRPCENCHQKVMWHSRLCSAWTDGEQMLADDSGKASLENRRRAM